MLSNSRSGLKKFLLCQTFHIDVSNQRTSNGSRGVHSFSVLSNVSCDVLKTISKHARCIPNLLKHLFSVEFQRLKIYFILAVSTKSILILLEAFRKNLMWRIHVKHFERIRTDVCSANYLSFTQSYFLFHMNYLASFIECVKSICHFSTSKFCQNVHSNFQNCE